MDLPVFNDLVDIVKDLQGILFHIFLLHDLVEKAAHRPGMAGNADLRHLCKYGIKVAVGCQGLHILEMAAGLTLCPKLIPGP